ncbi:MAG: hypothetical protein AAF497_03745 [Planctomycetota bacterium]
MPLHNKNRLAAIGCLMTLVLSGIAVAQANCATCQGRCQYGVDGTCIPKRATFGHYQSSWRRWPEPPPPAQNCNRVPTPTSAGSGPALELPGAVDESMIDPEFPHLRKKATGQSDAVYLNEAMEFDDSGSSSRVDPPSAEVAPDAGFELDLPSPSDEGASMNLLRLRSQAAVRSNVQRPSGGTNVRIPSRPMVTPYPNERTVRQVTYHARDSYNPLRANLQPVREIQPEQPVARSLPQPRTQSRTGYRSNPLR